MPVENSMNIGIRPASPAQKAGATEGVQRRGDGSGASQAFSPKTNVSIQNAVNDMAGILAKISTNQSESVEAMPETIQRLVQNVMKEAFALNETLAQGLGSTLESQRFSLDQLTSLSRMLSQLGTLAEKNMPAGASDTLQTLLTNLKASVNAEGAGLEPVLLTKVAFELLDGKSPAELPQQLQQLLSALQPQGQTTSYPTESSSSLGFLKQLVEYMMPRPASTATATANVPPGNAQLTNAPAGNAAQTGGGVPTATASTAQGNPTATNVGGQTAGQVLANAGAQTVAAGQTVAPAGVNAMPTGNAQVAQAGTQQTAPAGAPQTNGQTVTANANTQLAGGAPGQPTAGQTATTPTAGGIVTSAAAQATGQTTVAAGGQPVAGQQTQVGTAGAGVKPQQGAAQSAPLNSAQTARQTKQELMSQTIENTPAAMEAMRGAAAQIMQAGGTSITEGDALLLQSFINGKQQLLNAKETRELQQLIRLCQQNIPATVQQAAQQQNLPDLPRLWAFMQLCDMAGADTKKMSARTLKKAGKDIASFVIGMRASLTGDNTTAIQGQRSLNFMMPMYMDDVTYPAYIHVYDEEKQDELTGELKKETWLRLCVLTDNIGAVELTCRVYGEQLDMRVVFSDSEAARDFRENVAELKSELKDSRLKLNDFKIGAPGNAESV